MLGISTASFGQLLVVIIRERRLLQVEEEIDDTAVCCEHQKFAKAALFLRVECHRVNYNGADAVCGAGDESS